MLKQNLNSTKSLYSAFSVQCTLASCHVLICRAMKVVYHVNLTLLQPRMHGLLLVWGFLSSMLFLSYFRMHVLLFSHTLTTTITTTTNWVFVIVVPQEVHFVKALILCPCSYGEQWYALYPFLYSYGLCNYNKSQYSREWPTVKLPCKTWVKWNCIQPKP